MTNGVPEPRAGRRDRIGGRLRDSRAAIAAELVLVLVIVVLPLPTATVPLFLLAWLSLFLRRSGWRALGLGRPASWRRTLLLGAAVGAGYQLISLVIIEPLVTRATGEALDLSQFDSLRGNPVVLLIWLLVSWSLAAFGEEMVYTGYVLDRVTDLFRGRPSARAIALVGNALLFGVGHIYQGVSGVITAAIFSLTMGGLYLARGRNLWLPVLAHGVNDTIGFLLLFAGVYPHPWS